MANLQFKIVTKFLVDRLSVLALKIVSHQRRGFIKGRQIIDCICFTSEAINMLKRKVFGGNIAIKFDIRKALDILDWAIFVGCP